jgi:hypothetical protein
MDHLQCYALPLGHYSSHSQWDDTDQSGQSPYPNQEMLPHPLSAHDTDLPPTGVTSSHHTYIDRHSHLSHLPDNSPSPPASVVFAFDDQGHTTPEDFLSRRFSRGARRAARHPNPVAVPNLTKKARGRPVPTKDTLMKPGSGGRIFACTVEDCLKVFTRSEHLKRHTRSIHTNEKPFRCEEAGCGRLFTRHDNLLQHLKNHHGAQSSHQNIDFGSLEHIPSIKGSPDSVHHALPASPCMDVLVPPHSTTPMPYSRIPVQELEAAAHGHYSTDSIGVMSRSPAQSPDPVEPSSIPSPVYEYSWAQYHAQAISYVRQTPEGASSRDSHASALTNAYPSLGSYGVRTQIFTL